MSSWIRRNEINSKETDEYKDLLVFGYSSRIYQNDDQSSYISEERHMVPCVGDSTNRVDRYDCRLLLSSVDDFLSSTSDSFDDCPTEAMEEDMCEEERYLDMHKDIKRLKDLEYEEEERKKRCSHTNIGFDYGTDKTEKEEVADDDSDSEDEPFESPEGVKFTVGLELPPNMKLHHIIERTASFVVANGAQMEIVIKAKQRNNADHFGFMDFDHPLYSFYKYLQKLIREKKYTPNLTRTKKDKKGIPSESAPSRVIPSALAAIAQAHGSDSELSDSDSDFELHPSLLGKTEKSVENPDMIGPRSKPKIEHKPSAQLNIRPNLGDISQRNDVYASLFKNLAHVTRQANNVEEVKTGEDALKSESPAVEVKTGFAKESEGRIDDPDYREWYEKFYGQPCPFIGPRPMLPPTPDLEPIVNSYAEYVAKKGVELEKSLAARADLKLSFMDPSSPHYSYYHHKIRLYQWQLTKEYAEYQQVSYPSTSYSASPGIQESIPSFSNSPVPIEPPPPPMNRAQRRKLIEANRGFGENVKISQPGVFDPFPTNVPRVSSAPVLENAKPVSFTFTQKVDESLVKPNLDDSASSSVIFDPDIGDIVSKSSQNSNSLPSEPLTGLEPPAPPPILSNTQLDRKEKARIFMEKLLQEKKLKKQQDDEERQRLEQETIRKAEKISECISDAKKRLGNEEKAKVSTIDDIINSRISSILSESGFKEEEKKKKEAERKKAKRHKKSRSRSSSTSSVDTNRKRARKGRKRRSRSRSPERRRYRSRSRERSYRRY